MTGPDAQFLHALVLVVWVPALLALASPRPRLGPSRGQACAAPGRGRRHGHVRGRPGLPAHARESSLYGSFFALAATAQLAYVVVLSRHRSRRLLEVGVLGQLGLVVLWAVTRTLGPPLGPERWQAEPVAFLDVTCVVCEVVAVLLSLRLLSRGHARRCRSTTATSSRAASAYAARVGSDLPGTSP